MSKRTRRIIQLDRWLRESCSPAFVVDNRRRIVCFNTGCEQLTGWPAEAVEGQVCDYMSDDGQTDALEQLTSTLCPPPEVLQGEHAAVPVYIVTRDGAELPRLLMFHPLRENATDNHSAIGLISPIDTPTLGIEDSPSQKLHAELASLRHAIRQRYGIASYVAQSPVMTRVLDQIALARDARASVHLQGRAGTGKQHTARMIHYAATEQRGAFVPLDCRRLPARELKKSLKHLLEGEQATAAASGLKPSALYLIDVEHTPADVQQELVSGLEQADWLRLFSSSTIDLNTALDTDDLRVDFFYKLTTLRIELPELHARPEDVLPLAQHFLEKQNRGQDRQISGFSAAVCEQLQGYNWPGQLEELQRIVETAWRACPDEALTIDRLPPAFETGMDFQSVGPEPEPAAESLEEALQQFERRHIVQALKQAHANKSRAAQLLGINRGRLYRRMQALKIEDRESS